MHIFGSEETARGLYSRVWFCLYLWKCTRWNSINRGASGPLSIANIFFSSDVCPQHLCWWWALNKCMMTDVRKCYKGPNHSSRSIKHSRKYQKIPKVKNYHSMNLQKPEEKAHCSSTLFVQFGLVFLGLVSSKGTNEGRCLSPIWHRSQ